VVNLVQFILVFLVSIARIDLVFEDKREVLLENVDLMFVKLDILRHLEETL
jgi:hypothetical protein